ncbi:hypothetical protein PF005_g9901 [Phytophthora fragariae]|uniref:Integrase catalytic domain-containing protein n=1 Tax=Phytophthora fragariae TaxID=53985 RepID=A0A6A3ZLJ2_9STRA|nr:hypothetical protein PF003_g3214 [Phytophthora fragariae]KAE8939166.1 hypothetical protein PF009_g10987 [Phytophthora fragariae]KAE9122605.1 hypothetical protein PF007_g7393 [Phytophthora fragariae]KAE9124001.1 hypothetical protein PF010_g6179 [Phytophthora fragariae]KAE9149251.1 hypothetical protein PF006_g6250 [Phytophthora fragariae]
MLSVARCMLFGLPLNFWGHAVEYTAYVLNRSPSGGNPKRQSPLEMMTGKPSDLTGCRRSRCPSGPMYVSAPP